MKKNQLSFGEKFGLLIFLIVIGTFILSIFNTVRKDNGYSNDIFYLISSSENEVLDNEILEFANKNHFKIQIEYDDTLKIIRRLNSGERFDAVWLSNSIWMYSLDTNKVKVSDTKSTSINPIVFGIRESKAKELGFIGKELYTQDIVEAVRDGKLKFSMSNPVTTNSGASAYLGILTTLAGNPEVLTQEMVEDTQLGEKLKSFFLGMERSSGSEDFLEELFVKGEYEAVFTYESSIITINQLLEKNGKETLYALYPVDGVSISDSPIGFIDQKNEAKKTIYDKLVQFLIGDKGQEILSKYGRRTWYGGVNLDADKKVFNPDWGIDTTKYISPLKYPSTSVIKKALALYQSVLRKPVHVVFCLDYSGSMAGNNIRQLRDAMDYILTDKAEEDLLQFSEEDIIDIIPFSSEYSTVWSSRGGEEALSILSKVQEMDPYGGTALYPAVIEAIKRLKNVDTTKYNVSVIAMTDGEGNIGSYYDLRNAYQSLEKEIPIYSIQFGSANRSQLNSMADLSNGKVFDGTTSLIDAFMEVRGYN